MLQIKGSHCIENTTNDGKLIMFISYVIIEVYRNRNGRNAPIFTHCEVKMDNELSATVIN
jgi:hypothetical protein